MKSNSDFTVMKARFQNPKAEAMKLRSLYRDAALRGALRITGDGSLQAIRLLIGPDCAYHFYRGMTARRKT